MSAPFQEPLLGYAFHPDPDHGSIGYAQLEVIVRAKPTGLHFDPSKIHLCLAAASGRPHAVTLHYPVHLGADSAQVLAGRIIIQDRYEKTVEAFTFGGQIEVIKRQGMSICRITSPAPIIELAFSEPLPTLLVEEVETLLARQHAVLDQRGTDYEMHLAEIEPSLLYCVCLGELEKRLLPASGVISGNREMRHLIAFLPLEMARLSAAGLCPKLIPSVAELL